ncbi:cytochrome b [Nocardia sp. NPDC058519]|uniref:cytochrome b n=1 Tax=Nocardia sp. NPDC058519 TaxID=3346535 RepID=UPI00365C113B
MNSPATPPARFGITARILHWTMAVLIVGMIFLGAALVGSLGHYHSILILHQTVGVAILVLALIRIANRLRDTPPRQLDSIARPERIIAAASEYSMYALFIAQPVAGWALASASGTPIRLLGGIRIPAITPTDAHLYYALRNLHTILAVGLLVAFTAHMCAVLAHTLILRDQLLDRMLFSARRRAAPPADEPEPVRLVSSPPAVAAPRIDTPGPDSPP